MNVVFFFIQWHFNGNEHSVSFYSHRERRADKTHTHTHYDLDGKREEGVCVCVCACVRQPTSVGRLSLDGSPVAE